MVVMTVKAGHSGWSRRTEYLALNSFIVWLVMRNTARVVRNRAVSYGEQGLSLQSQSLTRNRR